MGPKAKRALGERRLSLAVLMLMRMIGGVSPAWAQSELGRGVGASVPYPYGPNGGRAGGPTAGVARPAAGAPAAPSLYANPYANPAMNPFLNPYAAAYADASPTNAALYYFAAQQSLGGIGSGQISGTRPRPSAGTTSQTATVAADRRVSDIPGAGAARYFHRDFSGGATPQRHYNRFGNYYSTNGH